MDHARSAIVFASEGRGPSSLLKSVLANLGIPLLFPHQLSSSPNGVSFIAIERPAQFALTICSNLRKTKDLAKVPILVLSELTDVDPALFAPFKADVLPHPVTPEALTLYLKEKVFGQQLPADKPAATVTVTQPRTGEQRTESQTTTQRQPSTPVESKGNNSPPHPLEQPTFDFKRPVKDKTATDKAEPKETSKQVRPASDHKDDIPIPARPLPRTSSLLPAGKGGVRCNHCRRWQARREDSFCSRCGTPLIVLEMIPSNVVTFEPLGNHLIGKLVELRNTGENPLRMSFDVRAGGSLDGRLTLSTEEGTLDGRGVADLLITLDARGLDLTSNHETTLEIATNENGYTRRELKLLVERSARPRIITHGHYIYALGEEIDKQWQFEIANDGGRTLILQSVTMDLSKDKGAETPLELLAPVAVKGGESAPVSVRLPKVDLMQSGYKGKMSWVFENCGTVSFDLNFQATRPPKLIVQPEDVDLEVISTRSSQNLELQLRNTGGEKLRIEGIDPKVDWLRFQDQVSFPLEIASGGSAKISFYVVGSDELDGAQRAELTIRSDSFQNPVQVIPVNVEFRVPQSYKEFIGIDFGTTASCIAVLEDGHARLIAIDPDKNRSEASASIMPSVLYFNPDGKVIAGHAAREYSRIDPVNSVSAMKRVLGMKDKRKLAGQEYDATELTAKVLEQLVTRAQNALFKSGRYEVPNRAIVTVPVEFSDAQRRALLDACRLAGLESYLSSSHGMVIDEALAAAFYYLMKRAQTNPSPVAGNDPERILVFDYGGGTLDCELIEVRHTDTGVKFEALSIGGASDLGGEDIDWELARIMGQKVKKVCPEFDERCLKKELKDFDRYYRHKPTWSAAYRARSSFKDKAEQAKIELCRAPSVKFEVSYLLREQATGVQPFVMKDGKELSVEITLTEEEFKRVLEPFLARARGVVEAVCKRGKISLADVRTILHAGRTSLIPLVKEQINALLPNVVEDANPIEPKVCVALGAAYWGYFLDNPTQPFEFVGGANRLFHDIGYITVPMGKLHWEFVPVFPAQKNFPCEETITIPRTKDKITLRLAENRGTNNLVDNNPDIVRKDIVSIDIHDETEPLIPVKFSIDENRLLVVSVNGKVLSVEIGN